MAQQINLCTAAFRPQKPLFDAHMLLRVLVVCTLLAALATGGLLWSLAQSAAVYRQSLRDQAAELQNLQAAIVRARRVQDVDPLVQAQAGVRQQSVQTLLATLNALQQGVLPPESRFSVRLALLAQTIPPTAWVTGLTLQPQQVELAGFTLDPAALNAWRGHLLRSPALRDWRLDTVELTGLPAIPLGPLAKVAADMQGKPLWSYRVRGQSTALGGAAP